MCLNTKSESIKNSILRLLDDSPEHGVFFLGDFAGITSVETVRKVLAEACAKGILSRAAHGIYYKPMTSRFGEIPVPLETIAREIADRDHVRIMPTGNTAANILGLSEQVPMSVSYLTSGSTRTVRIGSRAINFRHAAPRNFAFRGTTIPLIVQAFKEIGQANIDDSDLAAVASYLSHAGDGDFFESDLRIAPAWVRAKVTPLVPRNNGNQTLAAI